MLDNTIYTSDHWSAQMAKFPLAAVLAMTVGTVTLAKQSPPQFSSKVELVVLSAVVTDARGAFAPSLSREQFEVIEDGAPVPIRSFAIVNADAMPFKDEGRFIVLLLDDLVTAPVLTTRIKQIALDFASRMTPRDVVTVVSLNGVGSASSNRSADVRAAIGRFRSNSGSLMTGGDTKRFAMDAIAGVAKQLAAVAHRRKVLVSIGPAMLFNQQLGEGGDDGAIARAITATARAGVSTYIVDPSGLAKDQDRASTMRAGLDGFARDTGGTTFVNTNDFGAAVDQIWRESGNYYLLAYESKFSDERVRRIEVRVTADGLNVRARRRRG